METWKAGDIRKRDFNIEHPAHRRANDTCCFFSWVWAVWQWQHTKFCGGARDSSLLVSMVGPNCLETGGCNDWGGEQTHTVSWRIWMSLRSLSLSLLPILIHRKKQHPQYLLLYSFIYELKVSCWKLVKGRCKLRETIAGVKLRPHRKQPESVFGLLK